MKLHSNPYHILAFSRKFSFLLLALPLRNFLITNAKTHTKAFLLIFDLAVLTVIILWGFISMQNCTLYTATSRFILTKGVLHKEHLIFQKSKTESIHCLQNPLQKLLGVCKTTLVTSTAKGEIHLRKNQLYHLWGKITERQKICKTSAVNTLIMSAGFSPALSAVISFAPLVRSISTLVTKKSVTYTLAWNLPALKNLPPLLTAASLLLLFLWLAGVSLNFLRFFNLSLYKSRKHLIISHGFISSHSTFVTPKSIKALVLTQSLLMLFLGRKRADYIFANNKKSPFVTAGCVSTKEHTTLLLNAAEINRPKICNPIRPHPTSLIGYTLLPLTTLFILALLSMLISRYSPYKIEPHLCVFLVLWCCVWFFHSCYAFSRAFICVDDGTLQMRTGYGLSVLTIFVPAKNIACASTTQNPFQKIKGTCNLRIFIKCSRKRACVIRHIDIKNAAELIKKLCG